MIRSIAVAALSAALLCIGLAVSGGLFLLWPTTLNDHAVLADAAAIERLKALQARKKFITEPGILYFATPDEQERSRAQKEMDASIAALIEDVQRSPRRSTVLALFKKSLPAFERFAPEERDRACIYYEEAMQILGIESSGELLNVWRYGVPYGWFRERHP